MLYIIYSVIHLFIKQIFIEYSGAYTSLILYLINGANTGWLWKVYDLV